MPHFSGFAELKSPTDLVGKLAHDLERMKSTPQDQFAAFDFFVTAEHIVDWLHPDARAERAALRGSCALLRVTSHIANGAKHFAAKAKHHKSVSSVEKERYASGDYFAEDYAADLLVIELTEEEAVELGSKQIEACELADRVLARWKGLTGAA